jgi:hypothetical protein
MENRKSSLLVALISSPLLAACAPFACAQIQIGPPPPAPVFFQQAELQTGGGASPVTISADGSTVVVASGDFVDVFLNLSGVWTIVAQLTDTTSGEDFGASIATNSDGSTIVVGAPFADAAPGCAIGGGAAYVFVRPLGGWTSTSNYAAKLTNSDGVEFDFLGRAVTISGDGTTVVVGTPKEHPEFRCDGTPLPLSPGSAYVYLRPADGWGNLSHLFEVAEMTSSDGADQDRFGNAVAISGDGSKITVGAYVHNLALGEVYVFVKPDDSRGWAVNTRPTETSRLTAFDGVPGDQFGWSVATNEDGSTVAVGANGRNSSQGQAYVFVEPAGGWATEFQPRAVAQLGSTTGSPCDDLGTALSVSGDGETVIVGTDLEHATVSLPDCENAFGGTGAVYVFTRPRDGWSLLFGPPAAKLVPADGFNNSLFGGSLATTQLADKIVVGEVTRGVAYVFAQGPLAALSSSSLIFNSQSVGTTSAPQTVTLTNSGSEPLTVTVLGITPGFHTTTNCLLASPIAPGESCSESVTFAPTTIGPMNGTLSFQDNSGNVAGTEQTVKLNGTGIAAVTTTTITSVVLNPSVVGQMVTVSFNVASVGQNVFAPSGTVTVSATSGESCTGSASAGSCALAFARYGSRTLTAVYAGDSTFSGSTSHGVVENVGDFSIASASGGLTILVGASGSANITIGSLGGFSFPVSLTVAGAPLGVSAKLLPSSVIPPSGGSASSTLTVSLGPSVTPQTFLATASGAYGSLTRSTPVSVSIIATAASISNVISQVLNAACIDNAGIANALTSKLAAAQAYISAGNTESAIDVLNALLNQLQAQSGKHISTACTIRSVAFNPVATLQNDVYSILNTLGH